MGNINKLICSHCGETDSERLLYTERYTNAIVCDRCKAITFLTNNSEINNKLYEARFNISQYDFKKAQARVNDILSTPNITEELKITCSFLMLQIKFGIVIIRDFNGAQIVTFTKYNPDFESISECREYKEILSTPAKRRPAVRMLMLMYSFWSITTVLCLRREAYHGCRKESRLNPYRRQKLGGLLQSSRENAGA